MDRRSTFRTSVDEQDAMRGATADEGSPPLPPEIGLAGTQAEWTKLKAGGGTASVRSSDRDQPWPLRRIDPQPVVVKDGHLVRERGGTAGDGICPSYLAYASDQTGGRNPIDVAVMKVLSQPQHLEEVTKLHAIGIAQTNQPRREQLIWHRLRTTR
jgi:hypothetical protein